MPIKKENNRLHFLRETIRISGRTYEEINEMSGGRITQIPYYLKEDSCKLSQALEICSVLGYEVTMTLVDEHERYRAKKNVKMRTGHRLDFLRNAMKIYGIAQKDIAQTMNLHANTLIYNFHVDDMSIARIYEIADAMGLSLTIDINPSPAPHSAEPTGGLHVTTTILKAMEQYIVTK